MISSPTFSSQSTLVERHIAAAFALSHTGSEPGRLTPRCAGFAFLNLQPMLAATYQRVGPAKQVLALTRLETPSSGMGEVRVKRRASRRCP